MKKMKCQRGFTLTEAIVAVGLSSIVAYGITGVMRSGSEQAQAVGTQALLQESARFGLMRMLEEIRESAPDRLTVNPATVTFQIPQALQEDGDITWSGNITYARGGLNGNQLIRTGPDGAVSVLANDVTGLTFTANNAAAPTLVTARLDIQRPTVQGRNYDESLTGEAKIRNEN